MSLRDYQRDALNAVVLTDMEGCRRQLIALPTGTGKTRIASHLPAAIGLPFFQVMGFLVAQEELAWQAMADLQEANPDLHVTLEKAEHRGDENADIVVASVDTLARSEARLSAFARLPFRVIFLDECHAAVSPKYLKVLKALRVLKNEEDIDESRLLVGLTATPRRHDGIALDRVFDKIVYRKSIQEMTPQWLADPVAYRVDAGVDLSSVRMQGGDFATGELSRTMNTPRLNALVVQKYLTYGSGLPFLGFTVDIQHSEDLAFTFRHHGIECEAISSDTPKAKRKEFVQAHRDMKLKGLVSCAALLQGFDSPPATVALFARPTCSGLLYTQALGRVLRKFPAPEALALVSGYTGYLKQNAIIVDFVGASAKHRLYTASTLFGLHPDFDFEGRPIRRVLDSVAALQEQNPTLDISAPFAGLHDMQAASTRVDLWQPAPIPKLAKTCSQFIWSQAGQDLFRLSAPGIEVFIEVDLLGNYEVWRRTDDGGPEMRLRFTQPEDAFSYADSLVPNEVVKLVRAKAQWRKQPPTEAQCVKLFRCDPVINQQFANGIAFYWFAKNRYDQGNLSFSKGSLSLRIDLAIRKKVQAA